MTEPTRWVNPWADDEYPSIPGKPETYSPTYHKFHALLSKQMRKEPLSEEEAGEVYDYINELVYHAVPEGGILLSLYNQLGRERHTGKRCSVCGKYEDKSCILGC